MAELLETSELLANSFQPKVKHRWTLAINGIDAFTLKTCTRPQCTFDEVVIDFINQKRYLAGKATWAPITVSLLDPIVPSASQKVAEWVRLCWENLTGRMRIRSILSKDHQSQALRPSTEL